MRSDTQPSSSSRKKTPLKIWVLLSLIGALMFVGKWILSPLANVEPVTMLITVLAVVFGWRALASVYIYVFLEIAFFGLGVWNVMYLYVWAIFAAAVILLRRVASPTLYAVLAAFFGLFFGTLCSPVYFITTGFAGGVAWIISGIPYDIIHAVANFAITLLAHRPLVSVLKKLVKY